MKARLKLRPGQKGTKALVEKYGDDFVCVRYRYDAESRTRINGSIITSIVISIIIISVVVK